MAFRFHYAWVSVTLGHLNVLSALGFARFGYTMILPGMKEGLHLTYTETGWLATGNFIGYMVFSLIAGLLASRFPPRRLILPAQLCLAAGLAATALAGGFPSALAARTFTGLASGAVYIPAMTLPTLWFAPERRGLGAGIQTGGSGLGLMLSGLLLPVIFGWFGPHGWRVAWLLLAALVAAIWIPLLTLLRNGPAEVGQTPYGAAGPPLPPVQRRPESSGDSKPAEPDRWKDVFENPRLWRLGLVYACFGFSYVIFATFFTAYLVREGGFSAASAGQLWGLAGVLSIGSGLLWGALADRIGKKFGLAIVFALHALCFAAFGLARATPLLVASAALFGLTAWSIPAIMAAAVGDYTRTSLAGAALGLITIIFGVGQAIGPPIGGAIADWTQSFSGALLLAGAVALLGCLGSLALPTPTGAKA